MKMSLVRCACNTRHNSMFITTDEAASKRTEKVSFILYCIIIFTEAEKDDDNRMDIMFDRLMLMELRENVSKIDAKSFAELRSYNEPPKIVQNIVKAVVAIFYLDQVENGEVDDWTNLRNVIHKPDFNGRGQRYESPHLDILSLNVFMIYLEREKLVLCLSSSITENSYVLFFSQIL